MLMQAVLWTTEGCPKCDKAKKALEEAGYQLTIKDIDKLMSGEEKDMDALVQLSMQNMVLPIVKRRGAYIHPKEL